MKSREFKKNYHPSLDRYVYEDRGNGLIVDNIMKPIKGAISGAANKTGRAVAKAIGKRASRTAKAAAAKAEKSRDLIRQRLTQVVAPGTSKTPRGRRRASKAKSPKMSQNDVNTLINNLIARA